eukprot:558355-Pelagomonas_calceolata.AAC.1
MVRSAHSTVSCPSLAAAQGDPSPQHPPSWQQEHANCMRACNNHGQKVNSDRRKKVLAAVGWGAAGSPMQQ